MASVADTLVFDRWTKTIKQETLDQFIQVFNGASNNTIILASGANVGDFTIESQFGRIPNLVRRRDAYSDADIEAVGLNELDHTTVKVASRTPVVEWSEAQFIWMRQNPEDAGILIGRQLAEDTLADQLNTAIGIVATALSGTTGGGNTLDITAETAPADKISFDALLSGSAKFGDAASRISAWVLHSGAMTTIQREALTNSSQLFTYDTITVFRDFAGRVFIVTDSPKLIDLTNPSVPVYTTLGLVKNAVIVEDNNDYISNIDRTNGKENIKTTFQAEWSNNMSVKGFSWDRQTGGKSPNNMALFSAENWDQYLDSNKHLAGVVIKSH